METSKLIQSLQEDIEFRTELVHEQMGLIQVALQRTKVNLDSKRYHRFTTFETTEINRRLAELAILSKQLETLMKLQES